MAHLDLTPADSKSGVLHRMLTMRLQRVHNMLLAAAIASATIVVVAATMMTRI